MNDIAVACIILFFTGVTTVGQTAMGWQTYNDRDHKFVAVLIIAFGYLAIDLALALYFQWYLSLWTVPLIVFVPCLAWPTIGYLERTSVKK